MKFSVLVACVIIMSLGQIVRCRFEMGTYAKSCYVCDSLQLDGSARSLEQKTKCIDSNSDKTEFVKAHNGPGVFGWPLCYTEKSSDGKIVKRGIMQNFDGTAYWKPDFKDCKKYKDLNFDMDMEICLCFTNNCNDK